MIGFAAERLMLLEVSAAMGAGDGEKDSARRAQRNGYRERDWETRAGHVQPRIPKLRKGSYGCEIIAEKVDFLSRPKSAEKVNLELVDRDDEIPF